MGPALYSGWCNYYIEGTISSQLAVLQRVTFNFLGCVGGSQLGVKLDDCIQFMWKSLHGAEDHLLLVTDLVYFLGCVGGS